MSFNLDENPAAYQIRAFKPGQIKINDTVYAKSLIITPNLIIADWEPQSLPSLTQAHLEMAANLNPTILLLGTGEHLVFPAIEIYGELINRGIGVEIMNTSAACRTFNALVSENRNVAAALIIW